MVDLMKESLKLVPKGCCGDSTQPERKRERAVHGEMVGWAHYVPLGNRCQEMADWNLTKECPWCSTRVFLEQDWIVIRQLVLARAKYQLGAVQG